MDEKVARDDQADGEGEDAINEADGLAGHARVNCNARDKRWSGRPACAARGALKRPASVLALAAPVSCFQRPLLVCGCLYDPLHVVDRVAAFENIPRSVCIGEGGLWMTSSELTIELRHHAVTRECVLPPPDHFAKSIPYASDRPAGPSPQAVRGFPRGEPAVTLRVLTTQTYKIGGALGGQLLFSAESVSPLHGPLYFGPQLSA